MTDDARPRDPTQPSDPDGLGDEFDVDDVLWEEDEDPPVPLHLSASQQASLAAAVEAGLQESGCDDTLLAARAWAAGAGLDWTDLQAGLESRGGYCDCEVLFNVGLRTT